MKGFKHIRLQAGLTQEKLAEILKLDRSTISKWETYEAEPRADKLPELAKILKCSIDELFKEAVN